MCIPKVSKKSLLDERARVSKFVESQKARVVNFEICEEGYRARIIVDDELSQSIVQKRMDEINFVGFAVSDFVYTKAGMDVTLVPITQAEMNDFVWNYIAEYLSNDFSEIEALMLAIGILEDIVSSQSLDVRNEFESYMNMMIH